MTGRVSDDPADSLRRELEAAAIKGFRDSGAENTISSGRIAVRVIWPLILAALEAARADERERLIRAFTQALPDAPLDEHMGLMAAAEIVRAVSDGN